jgi:hypothetical protein
MCKFECRKVRRSGITDLNTRAILYTELLYQSSKWAPRQQMAIRELYNTDSAIINGFVSERFSRTEFDREAALPAGKVARTSRYFEKGMSGHVRPDAMKRQQSRLHKIPAFKSGQKLRCS